MSETSIRDLLSRAVENGPPPGIQRPFADVLVRNQRVLRRRRAARAGAAAVLALAGAAGLLLRLPSAATAPPTEVRPVPSTAATGTPAPDYHARASAALALLTAAVPPGYRLPARDSTSSTVLRAVTWRTPGQSSKELYSALLEVTLDGRAATLQIRVSEQPPVLSATEPCSTRVTREEQDCRVVRATDGTPVRLAGWRPVTGPVRQATRVTGGLLVMAEQAGRPRPGVYALGRPVLTDQQLANLAADPALLP